MTTRERAAREKVLRSIQDIVVEWGNGRPFDNPESLYAACVQALTAYRRAVRAAQQGEQ